ncbi:MAG: biopolymer transporter ExbD [Gammaproteobacteria bacterium]
MAFGHFEKGGDEPVSEINMIPLVDVMLVLLVIFIITAPVMTHAVKLDLPKASSQPNQVDPETVTVSIDRDGHLYWDDQPVDENVLPTRLAAVAANTVVQVRADAATPYRVVARVMAEANRAGITRLGLVTEPDS